MSNHKITGNQIQCIFILFWMGSIVMSGGSKDSRQDYWVAVLCSGILYLPMLALYMRLSCLYPGLNLFEIIYKIFGKIMGGILTLIFVFFSLHLGSMVIEVLSQFIQVTSMPETPTAIFAVIAILISCRSVVNGPENIGRVAKVTAVLFVVFIIFTAVIGLKDMKFSNLAPVMATGFKPVLKASFTLYTLPLAEAFICLAVFSAVDKDVNMKAALLKAFIVALGIFLIVALRNILILGVPCVQNFYFPSYHAVSILSIGEFFTRFEIFIGIDLVLAGFTKICVCLYASSLGLTKLFGLQDQKSMIAPCAVILLTLSQNLFASVQCLFDFFGKYYPIYAFPFETLLPVVILIGAEIQKRWKADGIKQETSKI